MDFTHDEEQRALRDAVRGLLARSYGSYEDRRRTVADEPGYDEKLWAGMAEMGVLGLPFAEADGGVGAGPVETALVAEELGRVIAPEPFLTSVVLAGGLVAATGTAAQRAEILGGLAEGEVLLAPALAEPGRRWSAAAYDVRAEQVGDGWTLTGVKEPVPHGARADRLVVTAALADASTGVFVVAGDADGLTRTGYAVHDGSRASRVELAGTPASRLGDGTGDLSAAVAEVLDTARVVACHQAVGAMTVALESTTDYLGSRQQFGVPLSTFQALTFRAADMYVSLELARSVAAWATLVHAADSSVGGPSAGEAATRAALQVSRAARHVGQEAIQLHGGIAMTAEYHVGTYVSHLTALDHLLGDGDHHLRTLAGVVGEHAEVDPLP